MPAVFQALIPTPSYAGLSNILIQGDAESAEINLSGIYTGAGGEAIDRKTVTMTPLAFFTALQAATGSWKVRVYKVFLIQINQVGAVIS